jgi:hypothetical protein
MREKMDVGGWSGLRDYAETRDGRPLLVVGEFVTVFFQLCFLDDGFHPGPGVTSDEGRAEEIHGGCRVYSDANDGECVFRWLVA